MGIADRVLLSLSRPPQGRDYFQSDDCVQVDNALDLLLDQFGPGILDDIRGKDVLDCGCGYGKHAVAYLRSGARHVTAVDIGPENIAHTRALVKEHGLESGVTAVLADAAEIRLEPETVDTVITVNTFEHFMNPEGVLSACHRPLRRGGKFVITFGPPWLHPFGSHMHYFTKLPWVHLLFPERVVMQVRSSFRDDGARRYGEVEGGLNQMTVRRFKNLAREAGYAIERLDLRAIKGIDVLTRLPLAGELLTNRVNCILVKP
jgi:ubiquinone/menaquinone biosynthesis C-methylase UbiE